MHGLIFETSIWLLAGSTRFVSNHLSKHMVRVHTLLERKAFLQLPLKANYALNTWKASVRMYGNTLLLDSRKTFRGNRYKQSSEPQCCSWHCPCEAFWLEQSLLPQECFTRSTPWCLRESTCVWWYNDNNWLGLQAIISLHLTCQASKFSKLVSSASTRWTFAFGKIKGKMPGWLIYAAKTPSASKCNYGPFLSPLRCIIITEEKRRE